MKQFKKYLCLALLVAAPISIFATSCDTYGSCSTDNSCESNSNEPKTSYNPIMQLGSNLYTQYHKPSYHNHYDPDKCEWKYTIDLTFRHSQSYEGKKIAQGTFGKSTLWFQGSRVKSPDGSTSIVSSDSLLADYFGMSPDTDLKINLNPKISNNIAEINLGAHGEKAWINFSGSFIRSKFELNNCGILGAAGATDLQKANTITVSDTVVTAKSDPAEAFVSKYYESINKASKEDLINTDQISFTKLVTNDDGKKGNEVYVGYMGSISSPGITLSGKSQIVASGSTITKPQVAGLSLNDALSGKGFGDFKGRTYNKFDLSNSCNSECKVADLQLKIGYDFIKKDCHHFGIYAIGILPTGTEFNADRAKSVFPVSIGNGKHWELGAGLTAHAELWNCDDKYLDINVDAYATHMFKHSTFRTFDLDSKPLTRFALLKKITNNSSANPKIGEDDTLTQEDDAYPYTGVLVSAGDFNSGCVDVSVDIRGEAIIDLTYSACDWKAGMGYAFSGKSREKICKTTSEECAKSSSSFYGLKGISAVSNIGYAVSLVKGATAASTYKENSGETSIVYNNDIDPESDMYRYNLTINNTSDLSADELKEKLITAPSFNSSGLMGGQILHRLFGHVDYTWSENCWMPKVGIIASVSFSPCSYKTAQNWDIGAGLGFSF